MMLGNGFRSDLLKAFTGKPFWVLIAIGLGLTVLFAFGFAESLVDPALAQVSSEEGSATVLRSFFAMTICAAWMGALIVTREYGTGSIARTVIISHTRTNVVGMKTLTATFVGAILGAVAVIVGIPVSMFLVESKGFEFVWTNDVVTIAIGVFAATVLSSLWGLYIGFITRNSVTAISVIALLTWMIEPAIQRFAPNIAGYLFTLATTGVVLDSHDELLSIGASYVVLIVWLVALGLVSTVLFRRKDIA